MQQPHGNAPGVPVGDVPAGVDDAAFREALLNPGKVMLEPVRHQHRLAVGGLHQIFQRVQLSVVDSNRPPLRIVHRAIGHLQELTGQGGGVHRVDLTVLQLQNHFPFQGIIELLFLCA